MEHLPILFSFLSLTSGIACLGRLVLLYQQDKSSQRLALLVFFSSFSYVMIVAAMFGYWFINVDSGEAAQTTFAGLMFLGMGALELSMPGLILAECKLEPTRTTCLILRISAAWTALQGPVLWLGILGKHAWLHLILAFIPFVAVISWFTVFGLRHRPPRKRSIHDYFHGSLHLFALLLVAWDMWRMNQRDGEDQFIALSLPAVYILTSWLFIRIPTEALDTVARIAALKNSTVFELPVSLCSTLTAREQEMARLILNGQGNKEIAASLELSENTVRNHIYNLYQKLGIQKRMDLLRLCKDKAGSGT